MKFVALTRWFLTFVFFASLVGFSLEGGAWWNTGHAVAAAIAGERLTEQTKKQVNRLLSKQIKLPGQAKCYSASDDYLIAVASWLDEIKHGWWTSGAAKKFYSEAHYLDITIDVFNEVPNPNLMALIKAGIASTQRDNVVSVLESAIKSLIQNKSEEEKAFALRFLVHGIADMTCPMHMSDPNDNSQVPMTYGGNLVVLDQAEFAQNLERESLTLNNLHKFWDSMATSCIQVPYANSCDLGIQDEQLLRQLATELNGEFNAALERPLSESANVLNWAEDSATVATNYAIPREIFCAAYVAKNKIHIPKLSTEYIKKAKEVARMQVFKAGARLGFLLNAIYDPVNGSRIYGEYLQNLKQDSTVKTLFELQNVDVQFY